MNKGKLFVVATPLGNLEDITFRAIETLKSVSFILAEDTRESKKLLDRYSINTQLVSYRDQNHGKIISKIVEKLDMGLNLAIISDNGTPLISDPGYKLVKYLRENNYDISTIPGPSAVISALSIGGLPTDNFSFLGFLSKSESKRIEILNKFLSLDTTLVIYESPKRLFKLLDLLLNLDPKLYISAIRDMTKKHEKVYFGKISKVIADLENDDLRSNPYGEWVILVSKKI
ncbi:MAG: 16S rRNA (cytidine(1402)-2'-O)-methyltransferase [Candidatus Dojkabacteria bacterium]|nr:16S rRNA (cytidine(1402)-2'-O)-methyltransferase [Candidatus Dojkabacteria bacterium]